MKYIRNKCNNYDLIQFIFLSILFLNSFYYSISSIATGQYPYIKRLNNGNYMILSATKIIYADASLETELKTITFSKNIYGGPDDIGSTTIAQFKAEDNGYIIAILNKKIFIFSSKSSKGDYLSETIDENIYAKYPCSVIPLSHSGNFYFFCLIYGPELEENLSNNIIFHKGKFDSSSNITSFVDETFYNPFNDDTFYSTISCDIMKNNSQEYITCLYGKESEFVVTVFNKNNFEVISTINDNVGGQFFKLGILPEEREKGIFCSSKAGRSFHCLNYDITTNSLTNKIIINNNGGCRSDPTSLILEYFYETEQFIIGCLGYGEVFYLSQANEELNFIKINEDISTSSYAERITIILPQGQDDYNLFGQNIQIGISTNVTKKHEYPTETDALNCPIYYNYERTACEDTMPEGYYCNSTDDKTIDKCHQNCKTCNQKGTDLENNCLKCKEEDTIYYNLGNCVRESFCTNGYFIDDNNIKKCKCLSNIKCLLCDSQSIESNSCIGCNTESGYYPKIDENNQGSYVKCYNSEDKGDGYYLNNQTKQYELCYERCSKCNEFGNDENNNCIECKSEYSKIINNNNIENCYENCEHYFYFNNTGEYKCTINDNCPEGYKLIYGTKKCIDNCNNDNIYNYKYEYNKVCYQSCPSDTIPLSNNEYL